MEKTVRLFDFILQVLNKTLIGQQGEFVWM